MSYYFVKNATTEYGPFNFGVAVKPGQTIAQATNEVAMSRCLVICHDGQAELISQNVYEALVK